jgi:hypothetical protein
MKLLSKPLAILTGLVMFASVQVFASEKSAPLILNKIAEETAALNESKNLVLQAYQLEVKSCWQLFAVNDCLAKAKREKYISLAPIEKREIELNAKRREIKEADRLLRLNDKSSNLQNPSNANNANNASKATP